MIFVSVKAMKTRAFLFVSLAVDITIAISKFIAAAFTGSISMISEGIHSLIDTISQVLLIWGVKISKKKPDPNRPFGYGRELYFWSFIVSLIIFLMGGCISVYEGIKRIKNHEFEGNANWNYSVLGIAFVFTFISMYTALRAFNKERGEIPFWQAIKESKDPSVFIVLLGDVGDMIGLIIAFLGIFIGRLLKSPIYDGVASILIGLILIIISLILVRESKSLLMGETPSNRTLKRIVALTEADEAIVKVKRHYSTYMAPEEVILQITAVFKRDLTTQQITTAIERLVQKIQKRFPRIKQIFIEPVAE